MNTNLQLLEKFEEQVKKQLKQNISKDVYIEEKGLILMDKIFGMRRDTNRYIKEKTQENQW